MSPAWCHTALATASVILAGAVPAGAAVPAKPRDVTRADERTVRPLGSPGPVVDERLSDEVRLTRHAWAVARAPVRARPAPGSPFVGRLRFLTEDGPTEVYLLLESHVDAEGRAWVRVRLPQRPNGRTGWVLRKYLGPFRAVRTRLLIDRTALRATLFRDGRRIWTSRVGIGAASTPTPAGRFWIRSRIRGLRRLPAYGPYAFGTAAYSVLSDWPGGGVVGIHGTDAPQRIPGRPSHGCVRVPNAAITRLWALLPVGTPVRVS